MAVDRLTSFGSVRRRCTKTLRKQPVRGIESWRHRHFVFSRPGLAFTASPCIPWQVARDRWHILERARLRFHRRKRSVPSKARPTMLAFSSNYGTGTRFGASRPFDHARSIAFCTFLRHILGSSMALNDWFFFSLLEIHCQCLVMCSSNVGTGKSPDLSDFHTCRSRQSLAIAPGQSSWPELRKGDIQEEQSISR